MYSVQVMSTDRELSTSTPSARTVQVILSDRELSTSTPSACTDSEDDSNFRAKRRSTTSFTTKSPSPPCPPAIALEGLYELLRHARILMYIFLTDVDAVYLDEQYARRTVVKVQYRTCRAVLEHLRGRQVIVFRKDFEGLVFKVAPVKTPRGELTSYLPADMSTAIPPQHAIYFEGNDQSSSPPFR